MCSAYRSRFFLLLLSLFASSLLILIVIANGRGTRDKGGFGNFEMLKPRGTDCTTAQKTCVGVPEHLRSSSSSKVDAHTTLRAVSAIPLSTRHDPRFRKFDTHARTHFESTDTQHSAHCFPSAIAGRPCHHGTLQHAKRTCTGSPRTWLQTQLCASAATHMHNIATSARGPLLPNNASLCPP